MRCLLSNQGTATHETGLCYSCYPNKKNQKYAREMASKCDDIDPNGEFIDCTENDAIGCCVCIAEVDNIVRERTRELINAAWSIIDSFDNFGEVLQTDIDGDYGPKSDIEKLRKAVIDLGKVNGYYNMGANEKKNTEIVAWYVCLIDSNDAEERLCADIPDDITKRIDKMIEDEYDVDW